MRHTGIGPIILLMAARTPLQVLIDAETVEIDFGAGNFSGLANCT
jgi:hypothetical protein